MYWNMAVNFQCCDISVLAIACGASTTYSAIIDMVSTRFTMPCYLSYLENATSIHENPTHCCGRFKNISRFGDSAKYCL